MSSPALAPVTPATAAAVEADQLKQAIDRAATHYGQWCAALNSPDTGLAEQAIDESLAALRHLMRLTTQLRDLASRRTP